MKTILVTGCLGTVGIKTINYLLDNTDYNIIGVDNCITNPFIRIIEITKNNRFEYYSSLYEFKPYNIDCVLHLAGITGALPLTNIFSDPNLIYYENNENFTLMLLDYCIKHKINKFIFASSSAVYGNINKKVNETEIPKPVSMYSISKLNSENYINYYNKTYNLNTIILRYSNILADIEYKGYTGFIPKITKKIMNNENIILYNNGHSKRQYMFIDNVVKANYLAITNDNVSGETFNITVDDEPISLITVCNYVHHKLNKHPLYSIDSIKQQGDIDCNWLDNNKAKKMLNYEVVTDMFTGIDKYLDYVRR